MKKTALRLNLLTLFAAIVCIGLTLLSPRFGYGLAGRNVAGEHTPFHYTNHKKEGKTRWDFYENQDGVIMSLAYDSRFLGKRTWTYGDAPPEIAIVQVDGGLRDVQNPLQDMPAASTAYDVVLRDAGGFLFLTYLVPLALILVARSLYLALQNRSKIAAIVLLSVLLTAAVLVAARIDTLLVLIGS